MMPIVANYYDFIATKMIDYFYLLLRMPGHSLN